MSALDSGGDVRIIGRYALHQEIAAGGMATVHLGRLLGPAGFSRTVAIKRLHAQYAKDPEFVSMFLDEARLAARIRHPNVVSTLDVVALDGELFIVMDYVEGESIARLVRATRARGARVPTNIALAVMTNVLYGLHGAHEAKGERSEPLGIVHRDVSPQNILVDTDGIARVVDFGVAKAVGRLQTTRDGQLKGKLSYMAPEQLRGAKVDPRTDVFAASIVLWELLTSQRLFQGENEAATFGKILECNVAAPSSAGAEVSPEIDAIVQKGLAASMDERFASALEMAEALERASRDRPTQREIGRWVQAIAEEALQRRANAVRELESHSAVNEIVAASSPLGSSPYAAPVPTSTPAIDRVSAPAIDPVFAPAADPVSAPAIDRASAPAIDRASVPAVDAVSGPALGAPAAGEDDDDEPTRLAEPKSGSSSVSGLTGQPGAQPEERSGSSQVSSIALERMKTAPPPAGQPTRRLAAVIGVAGALGLVLLVGLVLVLRSALSGSAREEGTVEPLPRPATSPIAEPVPEAKPEPKPVPEVNAEAKPEAKPEPKAKPQAKPEPKPEPKAATTSPAKPKPPKPGPTQPATKPGCNPPYTLDKDGTRIPKLECL